VQTVYVAALILFALACVIALCLIGDEPPPGEQEKPREGGTTAMPAQVRPSPPARRR
jgi:hypothetical protein